ncbi:uncharacterized protein LOC144264188 [Eretmochelys imbricata]
MEMADPPDALREKVRNELKRNHRTYCHLCQIPRKHNVAQESFRVRRVESVLSAKSLGPSNRRSSTIVCSSLDNPERLMRWRLVSGQMTLAGSRIFWTRKQHGEYPPACDACLLSPAGEFAAHLPLLDNETLTIKNKRT